MTEGQFENRIAAQNRLATLGPITVTDVLWKVPEAVEEVEDFVDQPAEVTNKPREALDILKKLGALSRDLHTTVGGLIMVLRDPEVRAQYEALARKVLGVNSEDAIHVSVKITPAQRADLVELTRAFRDIVADSDLSAEATAGYLAACVNMDNLPVKIQVLTKIPHADLVRLIVAFLCE